LVPFGRDLDQVLYCVYLYYSGPDGVPTDRMLAGAMKALARAYPATRTSAAVNHAVLEATMSAGAAPLTVEDLTALLLRIALLTRADVSRQDVAQHGPPENLLVDGALAALQWRTRLVRPPLHDVPEKPPFTASTRDGIAYIRVPELNSSTVRRIRSELFGRPVSGVVLDLRDSHGGLMDQTRALADLFLRDGCLVASRPEIWGLSAPARSERGDIDAPIVVLVDRHTAVGSELIAATLRARGRAILVGERTHGDAILQTVLKLDGTWLIVPMAELLAADGTSIQGRGLEPDVEVPTVAPSDAMDDSETGLAMQILRRVRGHTRGPGRDELLRAAHAQSPAPAR
jgi:hypothetical protein